MADKATDFTAPSFEDYSQSGFAGASGAADLQGQVGQYETDDASLRQQAEAQYKPTYEAEQRSLSNQLTALIQSQTDDSDLLNKQYEQSVNTMMSKLSKRGLNNGVTPDATVAALNKFRNEVMTQRQAIYGAQQKAVQRLSDTLLSNYELNIQARIDSARDSILGSLNDLLAQIAQLQSAGYESYTKYLLAKKKKSSSGGGGRSRRYSSSSSATTAGTTTDNGLGSDYFAGSGVKVTVGSIFNTDNGTIKAGNGLGGRNTIQNGKTYGGGGGRRLDITK